MGGIGSGRQWYYGASDSTDDYRAVDVRRWKRDNLLSPGRTFSWQWTREGEVVASIRVRTESDRVILDYRHRGSGEDWESENYPVRLDWTPCNFGGERAWFRCPAVGCGRRVAILYGGKIFACRRCYQLAYPSQRETTYDRAARQADKIRARLDWEQGILNPKGWMKPKGMHWRTFERLDAKHDALVTQSLAGIAQHLGMLENSILDFD